MRTHRTLQYSRGSSTQSFEAETLVRIFFRAFFTSSSTASSVKNMALIILISLSRASCSITTTESLSLVATQMLSLTTARSIFGHAHAEFGHALAGAITPSRPASASRCIINIDSLPMLVPQAHSPSRTSCSTDTKLISLLVHQMLALPAPAHATDMLSLSAPSTPVHGHLLKTQIKLQIDLAVNSTLVSGHLLDTQIKLQIDLTDITTLVSGHLLDTQIKLPIDLANNSQNYIPCSPTEASTLSPCCPPEDIAHLPCLIEINALIPRRSLEANKLPPCPTEAITLTPCCPLEVNTLPPLLPLEINSLPLHQLEINSLPLLPPDNHSLCFRPPPSCPFEGVGGSQLDSPSPPQLFYGLAALSPTQLFYGLVVLSPTQLFYEMEALSPMQLFYGLAALSPQLNQELTAAHAPLPFELSTALSPQLIKELTAAN
ncbi:hypothetical protein T492DRAFT_203768, partial [Pavlovales sp. CCMP2436]